jgi:hypothetical protein
MHANQIRWTALAKALNWPVLATSKLLGVMENNEETRQKRLTPYPPEAPYQSNPGFKTTTATTSY